MAELWLALDEIFSGDNLDEEIEYLSPDEFFEDNKYISLNDVKNYENLIKKQLIVLKDKHPEKIKMLLTRFRKTYDKDEDMNDFLTLQNKTTFTYDIIQY